MNNSQFKKFVPYLAGIVMAIIFGLTFLFTKSGLKHATPVVLLSYRFITATVVFSVLIMLKLIKINFKGKNMRGLLLIGFFYPVISMFFETSALKFSSTAQAGTMISLIPIGVALLGVPMLKEMPTNLQKLFIVLSVVGVIITISFGESDGSGSMAGIVLLLVTAIANSFYSILSRKYSTIFTGIEISFVMAVIGAISFTIIGIVQGVINNNLVQSFTDPLNTSTICALLYLGGLASTLAVFLMNFIYSKLPAFNGSVFTNLTTIVTIFVGVFFMKEILHTYQIIGGILIITGVWGTSYIEAKKHS